MSITFLQLGKLGRRGNQMFQASATIALALRNNDDYIFPHCLLENTTAIPLHKFSNKIHHTCIYKEPYFHYKEIQYKPNMNIYESYLQSYKYFEDFQNCIKGIMMPLYDTKPLTGVTSIHVRRGDYLKFSNCHTVLGMDYYNNAMNIIKSNKYMIFSDDIEWCKNYFTGSQFEFSETNNEVLDLSLMLNCENNIIAPSSFSWWGAYLNPNPNKIVIAPQNWFGLDLKNVHNTKDLYLPDWIKI